MRFSTIFTVLATGAMALAAAVPEIVAKRSATDVQKPFTDLSSKCDTITPKFDSCSDDQCTDTIVGELISAIDGYTSNLGGVTGGPGTSDLATDVANVVTKIAEALNGHKTKCGDKCPGLINTFAKVDSSLSQFLKAAFNLSSGLLALVTPKLGGLVDTLKGLSFTSVPSVCSLF